MHPQPIHYLRSCLYGERYRQYLAKGQQESGLDNFRLLTMAITMHRSSNPADLDITSRVNKRRNTIMPETRVKASTMVLTRTPAGVELSCSITTMVLG